MLTQTRDHVQASLLRIGTSAVVNAQCRHETESETESETETEYETETETETEIETSIYHAESKPTPIILPQRIQCFSLQKVIGE